ncbi:MAG: sodium-dependent transporter [Deltaproteobacteria bacterium]|nr:sodium-dependent transporter [Deltaproteobacteria bacterium]
MGAKEGRKKDKWGSRLGFILATSGAAVGLGNIQRFPYITAQNGGAAFVLVYLLCVLLLGLPLILVEFAIGRNTGKNPFDAIKELAPGSWWKFAGLLGIATAFFIQSYYVVVAGWTLGYSAMMISGHHIPVDDFARQPAFILPLTLIFQILSCIIVMQGLQKGIERFSKILMPALVFLLILLAIRSLTLEGSMAGLSYYLKPDFSRLSPQVILSALCQAFFSLCVGEAVLVTYGSYTKKTDNLISSAVCISLFDTLTALLAGLIIFPSLFAMNRHPDHQGVGLIFDVMPEIFYQLPFGHFFGFCFFVILAFAALTTCIALMEIPSEFLMQQTGWTRKTCVALVGSLAFLISIPAALSRGACSWLSQISAGLNSNTRGVYEIMDFIWGNLAMVIGGLLLAIFVGWKWGTHHAAEELSQGAPGFRRLAPYWSFHIRYLIPLTLLIILASLFQSL